MATSPRRRGGGGSTAAVLWLMLLLVFAPIAVAHLVALAVEASATETTR